MNEPSTHQSFQGLRCPTCDYDLRGLSQPVCPECGTGFDPRKLAIKVLSPMWGYFATVMIVFLSIWLAWFDSRIYVITYSHGITKADDYGLMIVFGLPIPIIIMFFLLPLAFRSNHGVRVSCFAILFSFLGWVSLLVLLFM